jgi:protein gp37
MGNAKYQRGWRPSHLRARLRVAIHPEALDVPRRWAPAAGRLRQQHERPLPRSGATDFIRQVFDVMARDAQAHLPAAHQAPKRLARLAASCLPSNVWMGVTVENEATRWRADELRKVPAAVRFISAEPLLEPLPDLNLDGIDWLIAGGESESGAASGRSKGPWLTDLREQCAAARHRLLLQAVGRRPPQEQRP